MSEATRILDKLSSGRPQAADELFPVVYDELRLLATRKMNRERSDHTLQATALVNEAWLRLVASNARGWQNRRHFMGAAAEAMRRILIDSARRKAAEKHGGNLARVELTEYALPVESNGEKLHQVHDALDRLEMEDSIKAEVVKLHFFAGLEFQEIAKVMNVSERTVRRYWNFAKLWLFHEIKQGGSGPETKQQAPVHE